MRRFVPYFGIIASLVIALFVAVIFQYFSNTHAVSATIASTTPIALSILRDTTYTPLTSVTSLTNNATPQGTTSSQKEIVPVSAANTTMVESLKTPEKPDAVPTQETQPQASPEEAAIESATVSKEVSLALVNILCLAAAGSGIHSISGSGTIVSPKGYVLTNAHIGEYFLLQNKGVNCVLRMGSPAKSTYHASLVFISPAWLTENANVLSEQSPSGTGEHDIAILAITNSVSGASLPSAFPSVPLTITPPGVALPVVIGSYGAQFLQSSQITSELFPTITTGSVKKVYTFKNNTVDVVDLGGSAAAQEGSSGGAVANLSGDLTAMITTSTVTGPTSSRSLNAITVSYVRADYASETGEPVDSLFATTPEEAISHFSIQMPKLESLITN